MEQRPLYVRKTCWNLKLFFVYLFIYVFIDLFTLFTLDSSRGLLLTMCSGIIPGWVQPVIYGMLGIEPGSIPSMQSECPTNCHTFPASPFIFKY